MPERVFTVSSSSEANIQDGPHVVISPPMDKIDPEAVLISLLPWKIHTRNTYVNVKIANRGLLIPYACSLCEYMSLGGMVAKDLGYLQLKEPPPFRFSSSSSTILCLELTHVETRCMVKKLFATGCLDEIVQGFKLNASE